MLLNEFEHKAAKVLFLEYSCILAMADKNFSSNAQEISDNPDNYVQPYSDCISNFELLKLREYAKELDFILCRQNEYFSSSDYTNHFHFINNILEKDSEKYDFNDECISSVYSGIYYEFSGLEECLENGYFPALGRVLKLALQEALNKYGDDKEIKQKVIYELISSGVDLMDINPESIKNVMITLEDVKKEILKKSIKIFTETKENYINEMAIKDKKIILFEMLNFTMSKGKISEKEMELIHYSCDCLNVDENYIQEFLDVIQQMLTLNKEAKELINE